ncbi:MAG: hypothetical protein RLZZ321_253 [Bacteroidota bacterium]|jgi:hypothetical protein
MKRLTLLMPLLLCGCVISTFEKPAIRKFSVTYWFSHLDESYAKRAFQAYTLIERDKEKLIFLVNGRWADTLFIADTKVNGRLHSLNVYSSGIYQFNGEITEPSYKNLKIEGFGNLINGQEPEITLVIE